MKLADYAGKSLSRLADNDSRIFVLDGDLADSDGAHFFAQRHPDRFLMAGIAEQNMVSVAAGMAEAGMRPFVFSFAAFLCFRAFDQIRVCLSQANQPVTLVASHGTGLAGRNGKTHASLNDLSLMLSLPQVQVWAPGDFDDVDLALATSIEGNAPTYIRLPRAELSSDCLLPGDPYIIRWILPKQPTTILSCGLATTWAIEAASVLATFGIQVGILHLARLKPLPLTPEILSGIHSLAIIEDHSRCFGLSALVSMIPSIAKITTYAWPAEFCGKSSDDAELRQRHGLSPNQIAASMLKQFRITAYV